MTITGREVRRVWDALGATAAMVVGVGVPIGILIDALSGGSIVSKLWFGDLAAVRVLWVAFSVLFYPAVAVIGIRIMVRDVT